MQMERAPSHTLQEQCRAAKLLREEDASVEGRVMGVIRGTGSVRKPTAFLLSPIASVNGNMWNVFGAMR